MTGCHYHIFKINHEAIPTNLGLGEVLVLITSEGRDHASLLDGL